MTAPEGRQGVPQTLLDGLNDAQRSAVSHLSGPLLVVAGPGSGKTAVLTRRVAALIDSGVPPWRVAAVTFTNRAAAEMRERLAGLVGEEAAGNANVSTFHSLCVRLLRRHHEAAGLPRNFSVADTRDAASVMAAAATDAGLLDGLTGKEVTAQVKKAMRAMSAAKNSGAADPDAFQRTGGDPRVARMWAAYSRAMQAAGLLDFDDLLLRTAALRRHPSAGPELAGRFSRLLVDEFQDTNQVQFDLVDMLAGPEGQVCAVGDPDQSIYAFRGASGQAATMFTGRWPDAKVVVLNVNYRSTQTVCDVSSAVIAANTATHRKPLRAAAGTAGSPVELLVAEDTEAEAAWSAQRITEALAADPQATAAVLVRANHQTRAFEKALTTAGIAHALLGTLRFSDRAEVKDVMSWLRVCVNPADVVSAARAAGVPRRGLGDAAVAKLRALMSDGATAVQAAETLSVQVPRYASAAAGFAAALRSVDEAAESHGLMGAVDAAVNGAGAGPGAIGTGDGSAERAANIGELVAYAHTFARNLDESGVVGRTQVELFCEALSLSASDAASADASAPAPRAVISTIHAAKGKEFDLVVVAGCEEGVLPHDLAIDGGEVDEERRLMFVACSRARKDLVLSRCEERFTFGDVKRNEPSRFLGDVPAGLCRTVAAVPARRRTPERAKRFTSGRPTGASSGFSGARSSSLPKAATPPQVAGRTFTCGQKVTHTVFGPGTVVSHDRSRGQVVVSFDGSERTFVDTTGTLTTAG